MSKSWSHRADLFRTSFSLVECDLLQSRGRARRFLSWQEQPSPNSNYTDTLVNDIRGLRLEKDAWSGLCPTPSFRPSGRPRKPAWRVWRRRPALALTGARRSEVFGMMRQESTWTGKMWNLP